MPGTLSILRFVTGSRYIVSMQIGDESLTEFMALHREEFGKEISRQDALEMATRVVNLYLLVYRPLPGETSYRAMLPLENHHGSGASSPSGE